MGTLFSCGITEPPVNQMGEMGKEFEHPGCNQMVKSQVQNQPRTFPALVIGTSMTKVRL